MRTDSYSSASERLVFLDWVRIGAFGLLVFYHVGMYYVTWDWHVKSPHASVWLEPWMRLTSPWRMNLLFLVSGAATACMLARSGATRALLATRARRILLPLLFGMLVVVPPQSWLEVSYKLGYTGSLVDFMRLYLAAYGGFCFAPGKCLVLPTWNHLWFLPYLFAYTLLLWLLLRRNPGLLERLATRLPQALAGPRLLLWPIVLLLLTRALLRPLFPETHAFADDWFAHSQYAMIFLLGAAGARVPALWLGMAHYRWLALGLALAAWALLVLGQLPPWADSVLLRPLLFTTQQWCAIVAALGFARLHLNRDSVLLRTLTDAVFTLYILHQTVIIVLTRLLAPWQLAPPAEGLLLVLATFSLCLLGYAVIRRLRWARPLFGVQMRAPQAGPPKPLTVEPVAPASLPQG